MLSKILRMAAGGSLLVVMLALAGCSSGAPLAAAPTPTPAEVAAPVRSSSSVMAEGKVVPLQSASLSLAAGGVVESVLVKEGNSVKAGQPLVRLAGSARLQAAVSAAELELLTSQVALDDLRNGASVARANAELALAEAQKELKKAKDRVLSKDYTRGDQEQIDTARANYIIAQDAVKRATELYDKMDDRDQDDPVRAEAFSQLAAARQKSDTALANLNYLLQKPSDLDINEVNAKLSVAQANVDEAQRQVSLLQNGPEASKLSLAEARVKNAQVSLDAAKTAVADLELKAPFDGVISAMNIHPGESAAPGVTVATIADFSSWNVETTDLTELNIARVKTGQPALVRFDALPEIESIARVTSIKAFGENRQGDVVYTIVLRLDSPDPRLRWNMTASVTFLEK